jgi:23S rRNA pseudouridine2605 synthase
MHPSSEIEREYLVRVRGQPPSSVVRQLQAGVRLEDGPARFDRISQDRGARADEDPSHSTFRVVLHEGRNREVRRLWNAVGFDVSRLLRVRYGPIELPRDLRPGRSRRAEASALRRLEEAVRGPAARQGGRADGPAGSPG